MSESSFVSYHKITEWKRGFYNVLIIPVSNEVVILTLAQIFIFMNANTNILKVRLIRKELKAKEIKYIIESQTSLARPSSGISIKDSCLSLDLEFLCCVTIWHDATTWPNYIKWGYWQSYPENGLTNTTLIQLRNWALPSQTLLHWNLVTCNPLLLLRSFHVIIHSCTRNILVTEHFLFEVLCALHQVML